MSKKIKVLHYIPGFNDGGIESRLVDWYRNIDREKIDFVVVKMGDHLSAKAIEFKKLGGRFRTIPKLNIKNIFTYKKALNETLKEERPDIVHVHCMNTGYFCLKAAKKLKIKTRILHSRTTSFLPDEKHILIKKIIKSLTPKYATDYFACSYEAGIWGNGKKNAKKTTVINNGIELPLFEFNRTIREEKRKELNLSNKIIIGTIGRLSSQKNLPFLINIFSKIVNLDKQQKYHLVIVGSGNMKDELIQIVKNKNLQERVTFIESKSDVWNYYMAFDVFISTSFYEGFGTTAIEAQATGLPTILSTGFPKTVEISNYITRLSLKDSLGVWANTVINTPSRKRTKKDASNVEKHGYSAKAVGKLLEQYYIEASKR